MARLICTVVFLVVAGVVGWAAEPNAEPEVRTSRNSKVPIKFTRDSYEGGLAIISKEIGVPIEVDRRDMLLEGFVPGQSHGLDEPDSTVEQTIRTFLLKCHPADKLAYVVRKNAEGVDTVYIVSRVQAAKRGETLFPEFKLGPLRREPEFAENVTPWSACIQAKTLEVEVRRQVAVLGEAVKSKSPRASRAAVAELALLFRVIDEYENAEEGAKEVRVPWKSDAGQVWQHLASSLPPLTPWSDSQQAQMVALYEELQKLMQSGKWPRAKVEPTHFTWPQLASRADIMRRINLAYDEHLQTWTGQEADTAAALANVLREAELTAALARVLQARSYEYAKDPDYVKHALSFEQQLRTITAAARNNSPNLRLEIMRLGKSCSDCHSDYR